MTKQIYLLILLAVSCSFAKAQPVKNVKELSWLEGNWKRTNSKAGQSGVEMWTKVSSTELKGRGITLNGSDTAFVEKIRIIVQDGSLYYIADVPENKKAVYFLLTEVKPTSFTCENPAHDFPKKIAYSLKDTKLTATISGNGKSMEYVFEKNP
ncbi:MAG TPA: DUF6265 family protein [Chryseolinea sp.]|nr:DUF6265 family protein [Chryseolinea sp.]